MKLELGDLILTKKSHPCGGNEFEITRKGADMRMRCLKCQKEIWIERIKLEKRIKKVNNQVPER